MAKQDALSIYIDDTTKDKLAEIQGEVLENIQKGAISEQIKNKNYSGDPTSGSVEISRFANATVNAKGTARTNAKGDKLENSGKVTINVDTDKEIVEEVAKKDVKLYGVAGLVEKRKSNYVKRMIADLDTAFFAKAEAEGTAVTPTAGATTLVKKLEELILSVEKTVNDYVDGVDRDMLVLTVLPEIYSQVGDYIDTITNANGGTVNEEMFRKVRIFSNHRQTSAAICMIDGAVAQLVTVDEYDAEKIPLSNDIGLELFYSRGTKAVMPDLIKKIAEL